MAPRGDTPRRFRRGVAALVLAAVLLLGGVAVVGALLADQIDQLGHNAATTERLVNANVRTLGQAQREILRLELHIAGDTTDPVGLRLHRAFVDQRMQEIAMPYQTEAVGGRRLLVRVRAHTRRWRDNVRPLVNAFIADPTPAARLRAERALGALERDFTRLAADAETSRRSQAAEIHATATRLLSSSRTTLAGFGIAALLVLLCGGAALWRLRRLSVERERSAADLRALNVELAKLSMVASATNNLVIITDAEGRTEWVNEAFERVTGYSLGDLHGQPPGQILQGPGTDPHAVRRMREALAAQEPFEMEVLNYRRDGAEYWISIQAQPVFDDGGVLTNYIAIESDVTAARRAEAELRAAKEAAEASAVEKAQFLASMSHEIRTPLNAVIGLTGLLADTPLSPQQREYAETARKSGEMLLATINDILSFSALESGSVELEDRPFALDELVAGTVSLLEPEAHARDLGLRSEIDPRVPRVLRGDVTRLRQVLVNLAGNGLKFTEAGEVRIAVTSLGCDGDGRHRVRFAVRDTGIGIPAERRARLFQPFSQVDASTTRRFGGSGLGLAICRAIVELIGGEITVASEPGHGSEFAFTVALAAGGAQDLEPEAPAAAPDADLAAACPLRVLLAEDDPVNQMVAVQMLRSLGYDPVLAANGVEALEALREAPFDLVLMDGNMPVMDGLAAAARIREEFPADEQPAIVALTANALSGDRERFLAAGMDDYIAKPMRREDLARHLRSTAQRRAAGRAPGPRGKVSSRS